MKDDAQATTSIWMATANTPSQSRLKENVRTDVCVIGAGIAGMTTAYLLAKEGRSVVVVDDGAVGGGMTGRTTAHLTNAYDDRYAEMEKLHGAEGSRLIAESHTAAIDKVEQIVREERHDCRHIAHRSFAGAKEPLGGSLQSVADQFAFARRVRRREPQRRQPVYRLPDGGRA